MSAPRDKRWSKFYWQDWDSDDALMACSPAAQGIWMRMLCVMARSDRYGYLVISGKNLSINALAQRCSQKRNDVEKWVNELEAAAVFSRTEDGTIFCRRMIRDTEASDLGRTEIKKRWGEDAVPGTRSQRIAAARAKGRHTEEQWNALKQITGFACVKCHTDEAAARGGLCADHIMPIYQGGSDGIDNIQPMCVGCNARKGRESIDYRPSDWQEQLEKCLGGKAFNAQGGKAFDALGEGIFSPENDPKKRLPHAIKCLLEAERKKERVVRKKAKHALLPESDSVPHTPEREHAPESAPAPSWQIENFVPPEEDEEPITSEDPPDWLNDAGPDWHVEHQPPVAPPEAQRLNGHPVPNSVILPPPPPAGAKLPPPAPAPEPATSGALATGAQTETPPRTKATLTGGREFQHLRRSDPAHKFAQQYTRGRQAPSDKHNGAAMPMAGPSFRGAQPLPLMWAIEQVCEAAMITDPNYRGDWTVVVGWIESNLGIMEDAVPAIKARMARKTKDGSIFQFTTLRAFDALVRDYAVRRRANGESGFGPIIVPGKGAPP